MSSFTTLLQVAPSAHLQVDLLLVVSFCLESLFSLFGQRIEALQGGPLRAAWGKPHEVRTDHLLQLEELSPVMSEVKVPSSFIVKTGCLPTLRLHGFGEVGAPTVDFPEDSLAMLVGMQDLFHRLTPLLAEAVELHVHHLDELGGDGSSDSRRVIVHDVVIALHVVRVFLILAVVLHEGSLRRASVGHQQVLVDGDVVIQVLVVGDGSAGVRGHIVEGDVLAQGVVGDTIVQTQQVFTFFAHLCVFPLTISDRDLVGVVVDLDVQGL